MNHNHPAFAQWLGQTNDITRMFLAASQIPDMINLAGGLPEPAIYPAEELALLAEQAVSQHPEDSLTYSPIEGLPALREFIAKRFSRDDLRLSAENILITSGGMQGLDLIGKVLLNEDDWIAAQSPAYLGALDAWRPRQPRYRPMFIDQPGFDPPEMLSGVQFAYSVPNFSNPTGKLIDLPTRQSLSDAASKTGTWLVEDDPYGTLYYDNVPLPRILDLSANGNTGGYQGPVIYLGTLSKELAPGLRIGWVIAAPEMIEALTIAKQGSDMCTSGLSQRIALDALSNRLDARALPSILDTYRHRRNVLCEAMQEHLTPWFDWEVPVGGMFVWAVARDPDMNTDLLLGEAMKAGVCITPSSVFDPEGKNHRAVRINFTRNAPERLVEGVRRLATAAEKLTSGTGKVATVAV